MVESPEWHTDPRPPPWFDNSDVIQVMILQREFFVNSVVSQARALLHIPRVCFQHVTKLAQFSVMTTHLDIRPPEKSRSLGKKKMTVWSIRELEQLDLREYLLGLIRSIIHDIDKARLMNMLKEKSLRVEGTGNFLRSCCSVGIDLHRGFANVCFRSSVFEISGKIL